MGRLFTYLNDFDRPPVPPGRSRSPRRIKSLMVELGSLRRRWCVRLKPIILSSAVLPFDVRLFFAAKLVTGI